jgi:hypothetical protein
MSESQQTAVEWLQSLHKKGILIEKSFEMAKAMEKEQIIDAANDVLAQQDSTYYGTPNLGEQYYNETYNK